MAVLQVLLNHLVNEQAVRSGLLTLWAYQLLQPRLRQGTALSATSTRPNRRQRMARSILHSLCLTVIATGEAELTRYENRSPRLLPLLAQSLDLPI